MKVRLAFAGFFVIFCAACDPVSTVETQAPITSNNSGSTAQKTLFELPLLEYYQQVSLAYEISENCPNFMVNRRLDLEINERRNKEGRGSLSAVGRVKQVQASNIAYLQSYSKNRGLSDGDPRWCTAGEEEVASQSAASALLLR